jgi:hypothetical protein
MPDTAASGEQYNREMITPEYYRQQRVPDELRTRFRRQLTRMRIILEAVMSMAGIAEWFIL